MGSQKRTKSRLSARHLLVLLAALLLVFALPLAVAACGDDTEDTTETTMESTETTMESTETTAADSGDMGDMGDINIGYIAWDECISTTYLWKNILEGQGYSVTLTQLDVAPTYAGLAAGDLDFFTDAWLPVTHSDYWEQYGDQLEDLTIYNAGGTLELTVPAYMTDMNSIEDLAGNADMFGGQIIGIEPGAGLTRITREEVMPGYGLDDYTLVEGSTPAMLAELRRAIQDEEPIVVTLWSPHWIYAAEDLKKLEDPQGLFGGNEEMHVVARGGFSEDFSDVAGWLSNFTLDDETLAGLALMVIDEYGEGQEEAAIDAWLEDPDHQAMVDGWLGM